MSSKPHLADHTNIILRSKIKFKIAVSQVRSIVVTLQLFSVAILLINFGSANTKKAVVKKWALAMRQVL